MLFHDFDKFMDCIKHNKVYIFGTGTYGMVYTHFFEKENIEFEGYVDNDEEKQGSTINGKKIYSVNETKGKNGLYVIATIPNTSIIIYNDLIRKGLKDSDIIYCDDFSIIDRVSEGVIKNQNIKMDKSLKGIFKGKRGIAIGNGPSLTKNVLEKIKNEYTFATNYAYQMVGIGEWKPTAYLLNDTVMIEELMKKKNILLSSIFSKYIFVNQYSLLNNGFLNLVNINDEFKKNGLIYGKNTFLYHTKRYRKNENYFIENDMDNALLDLETTMHPMLQIMIYLGFSNIYMVGMDYNFNAVELQDGSIWEKESSIKNHSSLQKDVSGAYAIYHMTKGFEVINEFAKKNNVKIYNATNNTKLDVFEKVNFNEIF